MTPSRGVELEGGDDPKRGSLKKGLLKMKLHKNDLVKNKVLSYQN